MRSKLFVPCTRPALFAKALAGDADAISFDLEDAVPEAGKAAARTAYSKASPHDRPPLVEPSQGSQLAAHTGPACRLSSRCPGLPIRESVPR